MLKKDRRILWLMNHKTLMRFEVQLLIEMGFEVFVPKVIPASGFRSGAVSFDWDSSLSIPSKALAHLNDVDFYGQTWSAETARLVNRYFGVAFTMPFGVQPTEPLRHFEGQIALRAFGVTNELSYKQILEEICGPSVFGLIKSVGDRFWFAAGYENMTDCEPPLLADRGVYLPVGLPSDYWVNEQTWRGGSGRILFLCPEVATNDYYAKAYEAFKLEFGQLPHVIIGVQNESIDDPCVRGFVSDEELIELYQTSAAFYYPSREVRHLHYSPIEAMIIGTPVVFFDDCLLSRIAGRSVAGAVRDTHGARELLSSLVAGSESVRDRIVREQHDIPSRLSHADCRPQWDVGMQEIVSASGRMSPLASLLNDIKHRIPVVAVRKRVPTVVEAAKVSRRELTTRTDDDAERQDAIDFTTTRLPLFVESVSGLSNPDSWGSWSDGPTIRIELEKPIWGRVSIEIVGGAYDRNLNHPIAVTCGDASETLSFGTPPWEPESQTVHLALGKASAVIEIAVPFPTRVDEGPRTIGFGLCRLKIVDRNRDENAAPLLTGVERQGVERRIQRRWGALNDLDQSTIAHYAPTCILCGYSAPRASFVIKESQCIFGGGRLERYLCPRCECTFGPRKVMELSPQMLSQDYEDLYSIYAEADCTANEMRAFEALSPTADGVYLNYGSGGWSNSTAALTAQGFEVYSYDRFFSANSPHVLSSAELQGRRFDGIYSNNVIEHFLRPVDEVVFLRSLLKRGGSMSHASPCFDYLYDHTRFHTFFPTGTSAHVLAAKAKLRVGKRTRDGEFICQVFHRSRR